MYFSIKIAAMAANLFSPPSYDQVDQFIAKHMPTIPVAEAPLAADEDFTFLPPWESENIPDPPLPTETEVPMLPAIEDTAAASDVDEVEVADNSGPVSPLPAYWVEGSDEPDEDEVAVADAPAEYVDGTDDDADYEGYAYDGDGYEESYDDEESYMDEYTEQYYRDLEERFAAERNDSADPQEVAEAPVDDSIDSDWYEEVEAHDPFAPVADEFAAEEEEDAAEEVAAADVTEAYQNQYQSYDELGVEESSEENAIDEIESSTAEESEEDSYTERTYDEYDEEYYFEAEPYENDREPVESEASDELADTDQSYADESYGDEYDEDYYADEYENYSDPAVDEVPGDEASDDEADEVPTYEAVEDEYTDESYDEDYYDEEYYGSEYDDYDYESYENPAVEETPEQPIAAAAPEVAEIVESSADPALQRVISNWDNLSFETRDTILSLVEQEALQPTDDD